MAVNVNDYIGFGPSTDDAGTKHAINHLPETEDWEEEVYQIESGDYPMGGRNGIANLQAAQLANRTRYLKRKGEDLKTAIEAIQPGTDKYDELLKRINALDSSKENNRLNHIERLISNIYLTMRAGNLDPKGYDWAVVEDFERGAEDVDQSLVEVTSVVSGDDSIDVKDAAGLLIGSTYQLTDGENTEEVQIKSINVSGGINRVILEGTVKNQYINGRTKLYRSSAIILNGRAYGGGNTKVESATDVASEFTGSSEKQELSTSIDFTDLNSFTIKGATVKDGKMTVGGTSYGVVLANAGSTYGDWRRINAEGDDLKQSDLA